MSQPASAAAAGTVAPVAVKAAAPRRPLPSIVLPVSKKQRMDSLDSAPAADDGDDGAGRSREDDEAVDEDDGEEGEDAAAAITPALLSAHNTPSPSFFAGLSHGPVINGRHTTNPRDPVLPPYLTRVRHAKQLVLISSDPRHDSKPFKAGKDMDSVEVIEDGGMVIGHDGRIVAVGTDAQIAAMYDKPVPPASASSSSSAAAPRGASDSHMLQTPNSSASHNSGSSLYTYVHELDARDCVVMPGLIDGHTHPVWAGDRVHEFALKLAGATYMDVHRAGGGIGFTVEHTKAASEATLLSLLLQRLDRALRQGTTLLEAKSGYGLELATELKMLRVIESASRVHPVELVATFCGAHSVPKGATAAEATQDVIAVQLPAIMAAKNSTAPGEGLSTLELIDVFCEKGVFELEDTRAILAAGLSAGLGANFHGDELSAIKAAELGAELGATAISHLEHISEAGMAQMAAAGVVATLLPTTAYILRIKPPPAKRMIDSGVAVALGSDFNPNAHCLSMPFVMNLACVYMGMTLPQALNAATINAAASLRRSATHGSLRAGKHGDFILLEAQSWEHLIYEMVDPPITAVFKKGKPVWKHRDGRVTGAQ